jgi:hypothetical protein
MISRVSPVNFVLKDQEQPLPGFVKIKKNKNSLNPLVKLQVKRYELVLNSPVSYEKSVQRIVRTYYNKSIDCV